MINKEQIICEISSKKIIAIARGIYGEQCINLAKALYDGGISLLEITYDQSNSQSVQDTADTLRALNSALGDKMMFGAGTVLPGEGQFMVIDFNGTLKKFSYTASMNSGYLSAEDPNVEARLQAYQDYNKDKDRLEKELKNLKAELVKL